MTESTEKAVPNPSVKKHTGGCHCGAVRFEVMIDTSAGTMCNCSICAKTAQLGTSVKPDAFKLTAGADSLSKYEWGSKIGQRMFCKHCGVHCFGPGYLEQLGGAFVSVNLRCIDGFDPVDAKVMHLDGRHDNWQSGPRSTPWPIAPAGSNASP
jgi:hypothetical protein